MVLKIQSWFEQYYVGQFPVYTLEIFVEIIMDRWYNKQESSDDMKSKLIKTLLIFVGYVFFTSILGILLNFIGINNNITTMFISDLLFTLIVLEVYKKDLQIEFEEYKKRKSKLKNILIGVLILFGVNMLLSLVLKMMNPQLSNLDNNSESIVQLFELSTIYTFFKTLLYAPVIEELIFKKSIRDIINNDVAFILISSSIYTIMNFIYTSSISEYMWFDIIQYFTFSTILSIIYIKNKNIIPVMIIKFIYNLIPTILLILKVVL